MRIVTDENIPLQSIEWLRGEGHEVTEARLPPLRTTDDGVLWTATQQARALLISTDKGFADRWA